MGFKLEGFEESDIILSVIFGDGATARSPTPSVNHPSIEEWWNEEGNVYEGDLVNGIREGFGILFGPNGNVYEGEWRSGVPNGFAVYMWAEGEILAYEGYFVNGMREGHGKLFYADGLVFEGEFKNDVREGFGGFIFPDGTTSEGSWEGDAAQGVFVVTDIFGNVLYETYERGVLVSTDTTRPPSSAGSSAADDRAVSGPIEISNVSTSYRQRPGGSDIYIDFYGTVTNTGDRPLKYVGLKIYVLDSDGRAISDTLAWPAYIGSPYIMPGEDRMWDTFAVVNPERMASYSIEVDTFGSAD
jgi:hypothetical protein